MRPTWVTRHAVERYVERHRRGWTYEAAKQELLREMRLAVFVEDEPGNGEIWRTPAGRVLVVRYDGAVATVLPHQPAKRVIYRPHKIRR